MAITVESIVGKNNMAKGARADVIMLLRTLPESVVTKRYLFGRWLALVGLRATPADLDEVGEIHHG